MKRNRIKIHGTNKKLWLILTGGYLLLSGLVFLFMEMLSKWYIVNIPFHSTIETVGGIVAILASLFLFHQNQIETNGIYFFIGTGLCCMGLLDTFHAVCAPGDAFIFLHSGASLAGGFFFMLVWLPDQTARQFARDQKWIPIGAIFLSLSVGLRAVLYPEDVPHIIQLYDGAFTDVAIVINTAASICFLVSIPKLAFSYRHLKNQVYFLFLCLSLLFGSAEIIFQYSDIWNGVWWLWHIIRLLAYFVTFFIIVSSYLKLSKDSVARHSLKS